MTYNILSHPDITHFHVVNKFKRHTNFANDSIVYKIEELHRFKPIVRNYESENNETYINYIIQLYNLPKEIAIKYLKQFDGNVYNAILFLDYNS